MSTRPFEIKVRLREESPNHPPFTTDLYAFIDSGAMGNFIHSRVIKHLAIPTQTRKNPLELQSVTGNKFFSVKEQATLTLVTKHGHKEIITLNIAPIGKHNIILGLPWCQFHEVQFDWVNRDIKQWSSECENRCFPNHLAPLHIQPLCPDAIVPERATTGAIGYDLHSTKTVTLQPGTHQTIPTGIAIELPEGSYGRIAPRSGMTVKHNLDIGAGVIDPDYRGEIKVVLINNHDQPYTVNKGGKIAQLIVEGAFTPEVIVVKELKPTIRNQNGFGSTDMTEELYQELCEIYEVTLGHAASTKILSKEERYNKLRKIIPKEYWDYLDVFDAELAMAACPEHRKGYDFEIHFQDNAKLPTPNRPYHLSREENRVMKEWLDGMVETGMISKCTTRCPTAAPVFFVGKKDGTKRPVIDYRRLNDITIRDSYPLPRINQIMDQVRNSKFFSKFDMKSGYNQLRIKAGDEWKTAFVTPHGTYQLNVMTFGFMNTPLVFQRFVDDLLYRRPELVNNLVGYLDDANTHNQTMEEHIQTNRAFLQRCREAKITLNPKKCEFHKEEVDFLGVKLSSNGFEMENLKVDTIKEWKPPRTVKGVREFIGFCNFYRQFVKNFAEVARPLHDLTKKEAKWEWGPRQEGAFQTLKDIIIANPVLIHPDPEERF